MAAVTTLAVTLPFTLVANANPKPNPVPTRAQVDRARAVVAAKRQSVQQIQSQLVAANAQLAAAAERASIAAEAYNGAVWSFQGPQGLQARADTRAAGEARRSQPARRDGLLGH